MLAALVFQLVSKPDSLVVGLRPGETAVELAVPVAGANELGDVFVHPRVLDARTAAPLEGVLVELCTEDGADPLRLELCLARGVTGRDGAVRLRAIHGPVRADKARLSKAGYASSTFSSSDLWDGEVRLFPAAPLAGRVLDLEGKPVVGATVHTRQTCKHAIPAASAVTDECGRWRLEDCPANDQEAELEVLSMDHEPRTELDVRALRGLQARYGGVDIYVARRQPIALRLIDAQRKPMANRCLCCSDFPVQSVWTDVEGVCLFPPLPGARSWAFSTKDEQDRISLYPAGFAHAGITTLRPFELPETSKAGGIVRMELVVPSAFEDAHPEARWVQVQSDDGVVIYGTGELHLPRGHARVLVGGDFSGWREHVEDVVIGTEPVVLQLRAEREPHIDLGLPEGHSFQHLVFQAGDDSCSVTDGFVPRGVPITVLLEGFDGELRRAEFPPLEADAKIDILDDTFLMRRPIDRATAPLHELRFVVEDASGTPIANTLGNSQTDQGSTETAPATDGIFVWKWMESTPYTVRFGPDDYCGATLEGVVTGQDLPTQHVKIAKRAHVHLLGDVVSIDCGGRSSTPEDPTLVDAAPGPLVLRVQRSRGPPLALDLVLTDGESRTLEIR